MWSRRLRVRRRGESRPRAGHLRSHRARLGPASGGCHGRGWELRGRGSGAEGHLCVPWSEEGVWVEEGAVGLGVRGL